MSSLGVAFGAERVSSFGVTLLDLVEAPNPTAFVALTLNVYAVSFVRPLTVIGLAVPLPTSVRLELKTS